MQASNTIGARTDHIAELIEARLGVRGRGLEAKLRRAGRRLPRRVRRGAQSLIEAERLMAHPRLARQTDPATLDGAYRQVETWLMSVDPAEQRKTRILNFLAVNAANLLLVAALFVAYLVWAGHV